MITNRVDVNNLLAQMKEMKAQAAGGGLPEAVKPRSSVEQSLRVGGETRAEGVNGPNFSDMFSNAIDKVNETQKTSAALAKAYEQGDPGVTLTQVMVASQKASVSFQAVTEVRNKLVQAYETVMKMPI